MEILRHSWARKEFLWWPNKKLRCSRRDKCVKMWLKDEKIHEFKDKCDGKWLDCQVNCIHEKKKLKKYKKWKNAKKNLIDIVIKWIKYLWYYQCCSRLASRMWMRCRIPFVSVGFFALFNVSYNEIHEFLMSHQKNNDTGVK